MVPSDADVWLGRGRDASYLAPPAQFRTCELSRIGKRAWRQSFRTWLKISSPFDLRQTYET
jgi:hypothetical protein